MQNPPPPVEIIQFFVYRFIKRIGVEQTAQPFLNGAYGWNASGCFHGYPSGSICIVTAGSIPPALLKIDGKMRKYISLRDNPCPYVDPIENQGASHPQLMAYPGSPADICD